MKQVLLFCLSSLTFLVIYSCKKEYSCENCKPLGWEFVANGKKYEGSIISTSLRYDNSGFSFYGPQNGTKDTLLNFGVEFSPVRLNADLSNIASDTVGFIYTQGSPSGVKTPFASGTNCCFNDIKVTINNFDYQSKIIEGSFLGRAYDINGNFVIITNGKFRTKL